MEIRMKEWFFFRNDARVKETQREHRKQNCYTI
jgi:hypothetical protein